MLVLNLSRWKYAFHWFLAVFGMLAIWILLQIAPHDSPQYISILNWSSHPLFPASPVLLVDEISWVFSMALVTLGLSLVLTSAVQSEPSNAQIDDTAQATESTIDSNSDPNATNNWRIWAGSMLMVGMGLVATLSGNLLTIMIAWAAIDIMEFVILMIHVGDNRARELATISFATRGVSIVILILAEIKVWSTGGILDLTNIPDNLAIYLILAAGLRLGVVPLHLPLVQEIPLRRSLGTILRFVSTAASMSLLVRTAQNGIEPPILFYLLTLTALAGIFGSGMWLATKDELSGRPYWILGTAALTILSAIRGMPNASFAWGIASLYAGGLLFFATRKHHWSRVLIILGFIGFSALPFMPTWNGALSYSQAYSPESMPQWTSLTYNIIFLISHSFLLAGYLRHGLDLTSKHNAVFHEPLVERWSWLIYPAGLIILPLTYFLTTYQLLPNHETMPIDGYLGGFIATVLGVTLWYLQQKRKFSLRINTKWTSDMFWSDIFSFRWLYRPIWLVYRFLLRIASLLRIVLEGDGGILWAVVLFFILLTLIGR